VAKQITKNFSKRNQRRVIGFTFLRRDFFVAARVDVTNEENSLCILSILYQTLISSIIGSYDFIMAP
jgi:hypothetical protein